MSASGTMTNCTNRVTELMTMMPRIEYPNAIGTTIASTAVTTNATTGTPRCDVRLAAADSIRRRLIASKIRGVLKLAATLMPNMLTRAPRTMRSRTIELSKALASTTASFDSSTPVGLIIIATDTTATYTTMTTATPIGMARGRLRAGSSISLAALPAPSNPVNA